jgi:hypothetical protein
MKTLSLQQVFDRVAKHLAKQKVPSKNDRGCRYRVKKDGKVLKCAMGIFMPKSKYDARVESKIINCMRLAEFALFEGLDPRHMDKYRQLQIIHDNSRPEQWYFRLFNFAENNGLAKDVLNEAFGK